MKSERPETKQLNVLVPAELLSRFKTMAAKRDRSISAETRQALEARLHEFETDQEKASV